MVVVHAIYKAYLAKRLSGFVLAGVVTCFDQLSKTVAQNSLRGHVVPILGPLRFELTYNSGVAFSIGSSFPGVISVIVSLAVVALLWASYRTSDPTIRVGLGLIAGGAFGNLVDRLLRSNGGAVIDFVRSGFWPTFNLADASIVLGAVIVLIASTRRKELR